MPQLKPSNQAQTPVMKHLLLTLAVGIAASAISASAQTLPGTPEDNGLKPKTATSYINGTNTLNNFSSEALSIDIANNGNLIFGWEDDGNGIDDTESMWTLADPNGNLITPPTVVSNRSLLGALSDYQVTTNIFLSYYRSDNTSIPGYTGWGPKVKANRFGNGIGMGAMPWEIGLEIPELYDINEDAGGPPGPANDFVCVQLMNNDGTPLRLGPINGITNLGIVTFADADVQPAGAIRLGGWDYLSNGNILIVGESRQAVDRALTGQASGNTPVYRIVTPGGTQVKGYTAVSSTPDSGGIARNGAAVTANGFAIRWNGAGGANVRLFANDGTPTTANMQLATLTGHPEASGGGDGGGSGINGNGKDAYVIVGDYGGTTVWVTVLNADGTVRWSRDVADDKILTSVKETTAAIDESGQVVVMFNAKPDPSLQQSIMGRRFDATGSAVGGTFYIGETEIPDLGAPLPNGSSNPKAAWRNGSIAVAWLSRNYPDLSLQGIDVIAYRQFLTGSPSLSIARSGGNVTVSWPSGVMGYSLESTTNLISGAVWLPVTGVVNNSVTVSSTGNRFYRLKK